jgi:hypothetical protein
MFAPPSDPTFLYDYFTAANGTLNGHIPDTPYGGLGWVTSDVNIVSNGAMSAAQVNTGSFGTAKYGLDSVSYGGPIRGTTTLLFTTGPNVGACAAGHKGLTVTISSGGRLFRFTLAGDTSGVWTLKTEALFEAVSDIAPIALTANTLYELRILVDNGQQVATLLNGAGTTTIGGGNTVYGAYNPLYSAYGMSSIEMVIGGTIIVDEPHTTGLANAIIPPAIVSPSATLVAFGGATATLTAPSAAAYGVGRPSVVVRLVAPAAQVAGYGGASSSLTAPAARVSGYGGANSALSAPSPTLYSTAHYSYGEQAAFLTAPPPLLTITTGANARASAPSSTLSAAGTVTIWGQADLTAPNPVLAASGAVSAMARAYLSAPSPNLIGYSGAVCSITLTGSPTLQASGTAGGIGGAQITCPLFQLSASATAENHGSANLLAPAAQLGATAQAWLIAPMATLTAIGTATVVATYEAYAVNLNHTPRPGVEPIDEMTHYTNFPFTHVVRYKNSYYGANSTGLYLLEGTTDDTTPIPWAVETAMTDFKNPNLKTLASAYFSGRFGPASNITLSAGEKAPVAYSFTTPRGALAQNHRQSFGRGLKARYYALAASGTGTCEIDAVELDVHNLTRRI